MVLIMRKTLQFVLNLAVLSVAVFVLLWSFSAYSLDFSEVYVIEMKAQERCFLRSFEKSGSFEESCLKQGYGAMIKVQKSGDEYAFGPDVRSKAAFCGEVKVAFPCLKRVSLTKDGPVEVAIVR